MAVTPADLRPVVEAAVSLPDTGERRRVLTHLQGELDDLRGRVARSLADLRLKGEGRAIAEGRLRDLAAGEAELRDELVRRGMATEAQMDTLGYPTRERVQEAIESGELSEWVDDFADLLEPDDDLEEALSVSGRSILGRRHLAGEEFNRKIRRLHGKFADKPGEPPAPKGRAGKKLAAPKVDAPEKPPRAKAPPKAPGKPKADKTEQLRAKDAATSRAKREKGGGAPERADAPVRRRMRTDDGSDPQHLTPLAFGAKRTPLVKELLGDAPNTRVKNTKNVGGRRVYTTDRRRMHRQWIEELLSTDTTGQPAQKQAQPEAMFIAGGPGSGKSTALDLYADTPQGGVLLELDDVKKKMTEFTRLAEAKDPYASDAVHREAADVLLEALEEAHRRGLSVIVDGVGNSGKGQFAQRILATKGKGYKVHLFYADAPRDVAHGRAESRAAATGRAVPTEGMFAMHANVPRVFEHDILPIIDQLDSVEMYDVRGDKFKGELPVRHAHVENGKLVIDDRALYDEFIEKQHADQGNAVQHPSYI